MRWLILPSVLLSALLVAACGTGGSATPEPASAIPMMSAPNTSAPSTSAPTTPAPTTPAPTAPAPIGATRPSAASQLAGFIAASGRLDRRLKAAALLVNGSIHSDVIVVTTTTARAVGAAEPTAGTLWNTLPAGLPPALRDAALLVGSDLVSRYDAMRWARYSETYRFDGPRPPKGQEQLHSGYDQIARLGNGHEAAARFAADLARLRTFAARTARITEQRQSSPAALDVAVRVAAIEIMNGGCDSSGGFRYTTAFRMVRETDRTGTIADADVELGYAATLVGDRWDVRLNAC